MSAKAAVGEIYLAERGVGTAVAQAHGIEIDPKPTSDRSICSKKPGRQRGVRLLHMPSVRRYFDRLAREQEVAK